MKYLKTFNESLESTENLFELFNKEKYLSFIKSHFDKISDFTIDEVKYFQQFGKATNYTWCIPPFLKLLINDPKSIIELSVHKYDDEWYTVSYSIWGQCGPVNGRREYYYLCDQWDSIIDLFRWLTIKNVSVNENASSPLYSSIDKEEFISLEYTDMEQITTDEKSQIDSWGRQIGRKLGHKIGPSSIIKYLGMYSDGRTTNDKQIPKQYIIKKKWFQLLSDNKPTPEYDDYQKSLSLKNDIGFSFSYTTEVISAYKTTDDWFYVKYFDYEHSYDLAGGRNRFVKCDQIDGLMEFLDSINIERVND